MKTEIVLEVVPATGDPGEKSRIEFYTQQRRIEFGKFLFEAIREIKTKESKKQ